MKRSLILSFLLTYNLFAITEQNAIKLYENKSYKESFKAFMHLLEQNNYQSIKDNFYFALSAEKIGEYNEAIAAYERILLYKPDSLRAKLEIARIYFNLKQYNISKQYFNKALKETKNSNVKKHIKYYLDKIEKVEKKNFFNIVGIFGMAYDSNINNVTDEHNYIVYFNNTPIDVNNSSKKEGGFSIQEILIMKDRYNLDDYSLHNDFLLFNSNMQNHTDKNLQIFEYNPYITFNNLKTGLKYDYIRSGNKPYISQNGLHLSFYNNFRNNLVNMLNMEFSYKNYLLKKDSERDSLNYKFNDTIKKIKNKNIYYISLNLQSERKRKGELTTIDNDLVELMVGDEYKISPLLNINPSFSWGSAFYKDNDSFFQKKRKDKKMVIGLKINNNFQSFGMQTNIQYLKNDSNIEPYKYNKWLMNLSFIKQFKGF